MVDPDTLEDCGVGERGELWLRGQSILRGICGRGESEVFEPGGWFRTGDLGYTSEGGHIWYTGRLDDMFKVSGASVYPSEVEAALRSVPGVREAHVTNVAGPKGSLVAALVVGDDSGSAFTEQDLPVQARERLSAFKVPKVWLVTTDPAVVPRSATAKVDIARLRTLLTEQAEL
jgi:acyl-CoA synthetase (AMP-forming)/AMP-acid ligase II